MQERPLGNNTFYAYCFVRLPWTIEKSTMILYCLCACSAKSEDQLGSITNRCSGKEPARPT